MHVKDEFLIYLSREIVLSHSSWAFTSVLKYESMTTIHNT